MAKNRIHSVLTSLPPLMLIIGLFFYYPAEQVQLSGPPVMTEQVTIEGLYMGTSTVKSLGEDQLFFWLDTPERARGVRLEAAQMHFLGNLDEPLQVGEPLVLQAAPHVSGSRTYWLLSIARDARPMLILP